VYDAAKIALRGKVEMLLQELLASKVSAMYRHLQTKDCAVTSVSVIRGPNE